MASSEIFRGWRLSWVSTGLLVAGDTDSERFFALITRHIDASGGDISAGITSAARWAAAHLPIYSLNIVLTTPTGLFALRYHDTHDLLMPHRRAGGLHGHRHLDPGELLHVDRHLQIHTTIALEHPPAHQLTLNDLGQLAASQNQQ